MVRSSFLYLLFFWTSFNLPALAQLSMPAIFTDHMVLQRNQLVPVWGTDLPGHEVTVTLGDEKLTTFADEQGIWRVQLKEKTAGGSYTLSVSGTRTLTFSDVLFGDVWICSGQSNMEWPVERVNNAKEEIANASQPTMRLFTIKNQLNFRPADDVIGAWTACTPETARRFSAVGYFFGRKLQKDLDVPIGLISSNWGGSMIEPWISAEGFTQDRLSTRVKEISEMDYELTLKEIEKKRKLWKTSLQKLDHGLNEKWMLNDFNTGDWNKMEIPALWEDAGHKELDGVVWFRKSFKLKASDLNQKEPQVHLGPIDDSDQTYINGTLIGETVGKWNAKRHYYFDPSLLQKGENTITVRVEDMRGNGGLHGNAEDYYIMAGERKIMLDGSWKYKISIDRFPLPPKAIDKNFGPTILYNGMISPIVPYGIKGVIWYQGESNAFDAKRYEELFPMLINNWRQQWDQGDFPFLFVQLANFRAVDMDPNVPVGWAELRDAQRKTLKVKNTGMALAIDIGEADDIHPRNKQEVGRRLAISALRVAYGKDIIHSGPSLADINVLSGKVVLTFDHIGEGLKTSDGIAQLKGFALAGEDGKFVWAKAEITGLNEVTLQHPEVTAPKQVKYGWSDNPGSLNLVNSADLPAVPFKKDI
ncbi:9-O-acetylesterase [Fulvivirga sp. M361]|uniref:sialate O-acetylesterase n=1 Tax=Fulvivirga sp. M361 TaxID=2594266 RepID=UPI00117AE485|nr:sialate O-acetylesterase [Fulvivirga sp. M361]TRX48811.1 9-O-acetylesterase [Fulvivirga sp. M361]